jgi:DNA-directed RNA polymerase subunit D
MALKIDALRSAEDGRKQWYRVSGTDAEFMNALRRAIIADLPSFAIDEIDVYENNSVFYNDYVANRAGLVPLTFDEDAGDDVKVTLGLNAEGPAIVYSSELKSTDEKIRPFKESIPLVKLAENQRLRIEAVAVKGKGRTHAKFQCAVASYNQVPKLPAGAKKLCRMHAAEAGEDAESPVERDKCDACKMDEKGDLFYKDDEFIFFVESYNNVAAEDQLKKAVSVLKADAEVLEKELK